MVRPPLPGLVVRRRKTRGLPLESIRVAETDASMRRLARCFSTDR